MTEAAASPELEFPIVGADEPKKYFAHLTKADLSHAYLFTGPRGIGKKTFARRLAQSLLCEAPKHFVLGYDGTCANCRLVTKGSHPDLIESVGTIKIGDPKVALDFGSDEQMTARDLVRQFALQSYAGGYRIFIFGDADFVTREAANALLRFFEEPPSGVLLLVTSATPGRLLPTIRSRLCEVRFSALSRHEIEQILLAEGVAPTDARNAARVGQGSVSRARATLEAEEENLRAQVIDWFFAVLRGDSPELTWATRETLDEGLEIIKTLVRDWSALGLAGKSAPMLAPDCAASVRKLPELSPEDALRVLARLTDAQKIARTNVTPAIVQEMVRMHLSGLGASSGGRKPPRHTVSP